jgi:hypothetical protein
MSEQYPGGILSKTAPTPTGPYETGTASGMWTLSQQAGYAKQGIWPTAGVSPNYIENVFSTWLYIGTGANQNIVNGIDLAGKGGMVWCKPRPSTTYQDNMLYDTSRGVNNWMMSNTTGPAYTVGGTLTAFNADGFALGPSVRQNANGVTNVAWTFRKQAKFFDVVTYTGNGTSGRAIPHSLGSTPGCIIVKCTTNTYDWMVYHRSLPSSSYFLKLNTTAAQANVSSIWSTTAPTATDFYVGSDGSTNGSGETYIAYIFAHDAGGFGLSGADNVISCGSYTGTGAAGNAITLGYEPQWVFIKRTDSTGNWNMQDTMRQMSLTNNFVLYANLSDAEFDAGGAIVYPTATGFTCGTGSAGWNASGGTYIYIAIRRGPMKTPTSGTSVFEPKTMTATQANLSITGVGFSPDLVINGVRSNANYGQQVTDRLRGITKQVFTEYDSAESTTNGSALVSLNMNGISLGADSAGTGWNAYSGYTSVKWMFRRAPGFFDVVCDTGTGSAHTITHNLGVVPELMIRKKRSATDAWIVYANNDNTDYLVLNTTAATVDDITMWNDTSPTSSVFTVGTNDDVNGNTATFVTYLFATLAGVSKVGSYTGTGTTKQIDCGFTGGARFVLIKRTDSTGDWYVWDTARGIVSGDDPYLLLNSSAAEVTNTDYVDTYSAGFELSSTAPAGLNANGGTFIFFAVA